MRGVRLGLLVLGSTLVLLAMSASAAVASKPSITGLTAAPNPVASGGTVTVSASVTAATECTISANKTVAGLPVSFSCESGSVSQEVAMPENSGTKAVKYSLKLTAKGAGGVAKQNAKVTVNPAEPEPLFTDAAYRLENVLGHCGTAGPVPVLISGDGTSAVWGTCTYRLEDETWVAKESLPEKGEPLALSRNGLTLVMAYGFARVEVFARSSESEEWALQATLTEAKSFQPNVAISADGDTVLFGAVKANELKGSPEEAPREFDRSGEVWSEGDAPPVGSQTCRNVVLSSDGSTALLGCFGEAGAYVQPFVRSGVSWAQQGGPLKGSKESATVGFATKMAISASGNTAVVGGAYDLKKKGELWVFQRNGEVWAQQGPALTQPEKKKYSKLLGAAVALSADGNLLLAGAPGVESDEKPTRNSSAVYVLSRTGESWSFVQKMDLHGGFEEFSDESGRYLALSESGTTALIPRGTSSSTTYSVLEIFSQ